MEPYPLLSPRMQQALSMLAQGQTYKEIAFALGIHRNTLHRYVDTARMRLSAATVTQAVVLFKESGYESKAKIERDTVVSATNCNIESAEIWQNSSANGGRDEY